MPITVTAPQDVLTPAGEQEILPRLTAALLEVSGLTGNPFFEPLIGATLHLLPADRVSAGGSETALVLIEAKVPNIGLPTAADRAAFITAATDIAAALTVPDHHRDHIWVNIVSAPDGGWGIGGRAYTGQALIDAITAA
jgi:phenylpyruvate tautomerase PptA (4-oxalocrotonate tautomerase family)